MGLSQYYRNLPQNPIGHSGGGRVPSPGMITLAHRGILFMDELPEWKRETIDVLRQPLEEKKVQLARSTGNYVYPADFMLVGAMNPCPCGNASFGFPLPKGPVP